MPSRSRAPGAPAVRRCSSGSGRTTRSRTDWACPSTRARRSCASTSRVSPPGAERCARCASTPWEVALRPTPCGRSGPCARGSGRASMPARCSGTRPRTPACSASTAISAGPWSRAWGTRCEGASWGRLAPASSWTWAPRAGPAVPRSGRSTGGCSKGSGSSSSSRSWPGSPTGSRRAGSASRSSCPWRDLGSNTCSSSPSGGREPRRAPPSGWVRPTSSARALRRSARTSCWSRWTPFERTHSDARPRR